MWTADRVGHEGQLWQVNWLLCVFAAMTADPNSDQIGPGVDPAPTSRSWRVLRLALLGVAQVVALLFASWLFSGVSASNVGAATAAVAVLAAVNAVIWPLAVRLTAPLIGLTVGLFTFVLNGVGIQLVDLVVVGFVVDSFWWALLVALVVTVVNVSIGGLLHIDDDHVWRQRVARRLLRRRGDIEETDVPGVLFIQVDGLGVEVLRDAIATGHVPTLAGMVARGSHRIIDWECDLSSQTGAMQAGILLGNNTDMPAFRWFEKSTGRVMVSNRPADAAELEARQSSGSGLLSGGGVSRANVFSGDADDAMLTFSRLRDRSGVGGSTALIVATPYALTRILVLAIIEIVRERREARRARRLDVEPQMHRGGSYPFLRAGATVALAELTQAMLVADIVRGVPSAYVDFVGYDEVAHHSGIRSTDALCTLKRTDDQLRRLFSVVPSAPRPYHVVILSDHGQTQGATFAQRYGESLSEVVHRLGCEAVAAPAPVAEGWHNLNGMLTDVAASSSVLGSTVRRVTKSHTVGDEVRLGPHDEIADEVRSGDIVVLASGNLGLVSFTRLPGRATLQAIEERHPHLVTGLVAHDGVGFVMVRDAELGDLVIGAQGTHRLDDGEVIGIDPLAPFGPNAARHLRRTASFSNCPDLLVNSFYDAADDEGAAFEELIGFHGGLGGEQSRPFILAPTSFDFPDEPIIGAAAVHKLFTGWLRPLRDHQRAG